MEELINVEFSAHALSQMKERNISIALVNETIFSPDKIIFQEQRIKAVRIFSQKKKKYLCVVIYEKVAGIKRIITTFITSKVNKYI